MATVKIEVPFGGIDGEFTAQVVDANGVLPNEVIRVSDEFRIDCSWYIEGPWAKFLSGAWHVRAAFESVGPGPDFFTDEVIVQLDGRIGQGSSLGPYTAQFVFPVGADFPGGASPGDRPKIQPVGIGVHDVAVILTHTNPWDGAPFPIAASADLDRLTIFADS